MHTYATACVLIHTQVRCLAGWVGTRTRPAGRPDATCRACMVMGAAPLRLLRDLQAGSCPAPYSNRTGAGQRQNCYATVLAAPYTILSAEICSDRIDNDLDGLIDEDDPDCWRWVRFGPHAAAA